MGPLMGPRPIMLGTLETDFDSKDVLCRYHGAKVVLCK